MEFETNDHLRRLDSNSYRGAAIVHWSHTIKDRRTGWLDDAFHSSFRELLIHAGFVHGLFCPAYCLMPDHFHLVWCGLRDGSDQLAATRWIRRRINGILKSKGHELQKQAHDRVLRDSDRDRFAFEKLIAYVLLNPERAALIEESSARDAWKWRDSVLPGYPEVSWQRSDPEGYWDLYWKLNNRSLEVNS